MGQYGKLKPGWKTTEFWVSILSGLAGIAVALELISHEQLDAFWGLVMTVGSAMGYSISRGIAKTNPNGLRG